MSNEKMEVIKFTGQDPITENMYAVVTTLKRAVLMKKHWPTLVIVTPINLQNYQMLELSPIQVLFQ